MEIPGYKVESTLGQGGMATVYLAVQESLERRVALKVMNSSLTADASFCERFLKEGKIIAQLSSYSEIVTIFDIGCAGANYYMAMEYISGANLKQRISHHTDLDKPLTIIKQIAGALGYAHARGFIHRDVKPANILFKEDGTAILTDFGIAKSLSSQTQLTQAGFTVGTPEYMSPEQAVGQHMDARSDLYSLGIVLYEMLTGEKPYSGADGFATALMHINSPVPKLPEAFMFYQPLLDRMLAKDPNERFENAQQLIEFIEALAEVSVLSPVTSKPNGATDTMATRSMEQATTVSADAHSGRVKRNVSALAKWGAVGGALAVVLAFGTYFYNTKIQSTAMDTNGVVSKQTDGGTDTLESAQQERVTRLLDVAEAHLAIGRFTEPPGSNAYEAFQLVLEIDPGNQRAQRGLRQIEGLVEQTQ